ncbi:hypothetical protein [Nocardia sp. MW-W600-9]
MPPTQRKPAAKRTTPRKTIEQKVVAFEELRARAGGRQLTQVEVPPYEVPGFDPPLIVRWPDSVAGQVALDIAARSSDVSGFLFAALGYQDLARVLAAFNPLPDASSLLYGLFLSIQDHFLGQGAGDVPGGTPASSTS